MSRNVRVLHIITRMVRGGAQENTLATVAGINGDGWESALVTGPATGPEGSLEPKCRAAGIRMTHVPELVREISPAADHRALYRLTRLLRRERPHLVHTHTSKAGILGRMAARLARVPAVIHTPHGHVFHSYESRIRSRAFVHAERAGARFTDRLVALTLSEMREHLEVGVGRPEQWSVIHSGVPFARFEAAIGTRAAARAALGIPQRAVVVGTVGRLVDIKGQCYLVRAAARLAGELPGLHVLLAGDGPLREELMRETRDLGLAVLEHPGAGSDDEAVSRLVGEPIAARAPAADRPVVHFLGLRRDVPQVLAAMDVFALPSLNEGMGRVLVEAMAMRLPCVASEVSGIQDVVEDGVTGFLVPPRDPELLAERLARLLRTPDLAAAFGEAGRNKVVPDYGEPAMLDRLEALYLEVLEAKGLPCPRRRPEGSTAGPAP